MSNRKVFPVVLASLWLLAACGSGPPRTPNPKKPIAERRAVEIIARAMKKERLTPAEGRDVKIQSGASVHMDVAVADRKFGVAYLTENDLAAEDADKIPRKDPKRPKALVLAEGGSKIEAETKMLILFERDYLSDDEIGEDHQSTSITAEAALERDVRDFMVQAKAKSWELRGRVASLLPGAARREGRGGRAPVVDRVERDRGGARRARARRGRAGARTVRGPQARADGRGATARSRSGGAVKRLLHVEDERLLTTTVKLLLAPEWEAVACPTAADAMAALADPDVTAIVCDLALPDGSAEGVYAAVRARRPELVSRFVVTTGGATTDAAARFLRTPGLPTLSKPFDIDELVALLARLTAP